MEHNNDVKAANFSIGPWQSTLFGGEVQPGEPDYQSIDIPGRDGADKREHDRARQAKTRKKAKNPWLIEAVVEQTGFHSFYLSHRVQIHYHSNIWDTPSYPWGYYQEAAQVLFNGYVPSFRELCLLLVVRISNTTGGTPLPLINYLTRSRRSLPTEIW